MMSDALRSRALLVGGDLVFRMVSREFARPVPGQALVRIEWVGVCASDLDVLVACQERLVVRPAIPGHEIVGRVVSCPGGDLAEGTRVVVDPHVPCGRCDECVKSPSLCSDMGWVGQEVPGGYQSQAVFDASGLFECPQGLEAEIAVLAIPLAMVTHALRELRPELARVLLLGYGPIGALVHRAVSAVRPSLQVCVSEQHLSRRQLAEAFDAELVDDSSDERWPVVIDSIGSTSSLQRSRRFAAPGGSVLLAPCCQQNVASRSDSPDDTAITIPAAKDFASEISQAITHLSATPDLFRPLITDAILLDEAAGPLAELHRTSTAGKLVIRP